MVEEPNSFHTSISSSIENLPEKVRNANTEYLPLSVVVFHLHVFGPRALDP